MQNELDLQQPTGCPKALRIALVGPLPPPFGGMANQTRQLQELLIAEGVSVTLIQTNTAYPAGLFGKLKGLRAVFRLLPYLAKLWRAAAQVDCFHMMANSGWSWQLYAAPTVWIGWFKNTPVIINYRGGEAEKYFNASIKRIAPTLNKATLIVTPSGYLQAVFAKFGYATEVVPNIINLDKFVFNDRSRVRNIDAPRLVITRNLEKIYGIDIAIEAIAILKRSMPGIQAYIAGSGPLHDELVALTAAKGLADNIVFTGKLTPDQVAVLYADADIMLNPTTVDNMPNSVLEAMAQGIPVVSTHVGGIPYLVTDNETALLVEANNPEMLAAKVAQLINDAKLYEKLVVNGRRQVENYAWNSVKQQWFDLYQRVLAS